MSLNAWAYTLRGKGYLCEFKEGEREPEKSNLIIMCGMNICLLLTYLVRIYVIAKLYIVSYIIITYDILYVY